MNAMTMINFENIVVDTEFGGITNRSIHLAENEDMPQISTLNDDQSGKPMPRRSILTRASTV